MIEEMRVTFYTVKECGYYAIGDSAPKFGNMVEVLSEIKAWSQGKKLVETRIGSASEDSDHLPIYLSEIHESQGTYLFTAWNEVPADTEGVVASAPANARVGHVRQVNNKVQENTIPGYPTFFWLLPSDGVLATLRFARPVTGQPAFQEYIEQFLAMQSKHAVRMPPVENGDDEALTVWAYRANEKTAPTPKVAPRFRTKLFTKPGEIDLIIKRVSDIRKVHRKAELEIKDTSEREMWQKAMSFMGLESQRAQPKKAKLQASMSTTLESAELKTLIKDWKDSRGNSEWDDCGFQFTGESEIHWLSGVRASGSFKLDVTRDADNAQINTGKLLNSMMKMKSNLLDLMR